MQLAMGTFVTVRATGQSEIDNEAAIAAALSAVRELDHSLHPLRLGSDIAAINVASIGSAVPITEETAGLLKLTADVVEASMGVFDPCLPVSEGKFSCLEIAHSHVVVHKRVSLDLGGIAKGFAVDEALAVLKVHGCTSGSVNVGGEVAAFGEPERVAARRLDGSLFTFELANEAIAITDANTTSRPPEHRGYYQRDNEHVRVRDYAAIVAPSAAIADALTKCALYLDTELAGVLARFDARLL